MTALRVWVSRHSLQTSMIVLALAVIYFTAPILFTDMSQGFGHGQQERGAEDFSQTLWPEIGLAASLVAIVIVIGWSRETGLARLPRFWPSLLAVPFILYALFLPFAVWGLSIQSGDQVSFSAEQWRLLGISTAAALIVGLFEELLFRGVLLHGLRAHMPGILAVLVCAVLFGAMHFVNWVAGQPFDVTLSQVVGAAVGGVCYGALVLWTGSIWPSVIMHGVWDAAITLMETIEMDSTSVPTPDTGVDPWYSLHSPIMVYGLLLLAGWWLWSRRKGRETA